VSFSPQTVAKVIVSIGALALLFFLLRDVDLSRTFHILLGANPLILVGVLFVQVVSVFLRLVRWECQLLPARNVSLTALASPLLVSFAVGNVTVTGVGSIPRVYLLNRRTQINPGFIAGTLAQEYILDATALVVWATVVPSFVELPGVFHFVQLLLILPLTLLLLIDLALWRRESLIIQLLLRLGLWFKIVKVLPRFVSENLDSFGDGLTAALAIPTTLVGATVSTALIWAVEAVIFWLLLLSIGIRFSYLDASAVMAFTHLIIGIPSIPGFVGTLEAGTTSVVLALGGSPSDALAYALLLHVFLVGPSTLVGSVFAWHAGMSIFR